MQRVNVQELQRQYQQHVDPAQILDALSQRDDEGRSCAVLVANDAAQSKELQRILYMLDGYAQRSDAMLNMHILKTLSTSGVNGETVVHGVASNHREDLFLDFLKLMHRLTRNQPVSLVKDVYRMFKMESNAYPPESGLKMIDVIPGSELNKTLTPKMQAYIKLVLMLARRGLPRGDVNHLLRMKRGDHYDFFKQQVLQQTVKHLLQFVASGYLLDKEYKGFADKAGELLSYISRMSDVEAKRAYLQQIENADAPLGKLFRVKTMFEFARVNGSEKMLKAAGKLLQNLPAVIASAPHYEQPPYAPGNAEQPCAPELIATGNDDKLVM